MKNWHLAGAIVYEFSKSYDFMSRKCFLLVLSSKCLATLEIGAQLKFVTKINFVSVLLVYR